jgi:drug/metabolite transporter (DMT)-like permease
LTSGIPLNGPAGRAGPSGDTVPPMGRSQVTVSIVASAIVMAFGMYLGSTRGGTDASALGWVLAFVGAVSLAVNLVLRTRMR